MDSMDLDRLYNVYYMKIYSYVMTIVKSAHMAEEVTQQVFYKALNSPSRFEGRSDEFTWLCAIAKNSRRDKEAVPPRIADRGYTVLQKH